MDARILDQLFDVIDSRHDADPASSWTARLLAEAPQLPARKLGEEALECVMEAIKGDKDALTREAADLIYHLLVVMAASGIRPEELWAELAARQHQSGLAEKASRP